MKLDPTVMRTMSKEDYRVLEAIEYGMKDHEIVPIQLIAAYANLRYGGITKRINTLLRDKLLSHETNGGYDGYRITNSGYDILALYHLKCRNIISCIGQKIGTGKESDIYLAADNSGKQIVLKFHRLGRTSFRNVRNKRDYFNTSSNQISKNTSWLFLSKLSALKEYTFMKALYDIAKLSIPNPIGYNRHIIVMNLIRGIPLYQIYPKQLSIDQAISIYEQTITIATTLVMKHGLVHCDLNEFNLLIDLSGIQNTASDNTADPYVRHSGTISITKPNDNISVGALSKPLPWMKDDDDDNEPVQDIPLPEPVAYLPNGQPKPVVTLIDFPQMISIEHINAQEYYERDIHCIQRFFHKKLLCQIPTNDDDDEISWNSLMKKIQFMKQKQQQMKQKQTNNNNNNNADNADNIVDEKDDETYLDNNHHVGSNDDNNNEEISFLSMRLDEQLRASGYYTGNKNHNNNNNNNNNNNKNNNDLLELYYFESGPRPIGTAIDISEEEEEEEEEEGNNEDEEENDYSAPLDDDDDQKNNNNKKKNNQNDEHENDSGVKNDTKKMDEEVKDDEINNDLDNDNIFDNVNEDNNNNNNNDNHLVVMDRMDLLSLAANSQQSRLLLSREEMHAIAKERVTKQFNDEKRKKKMKGIYKTKNNNKISCKGKKILEQSGF